MSIRVLGDSCLSHARMLLLCGCCQNWICSGTGRIFTCACSCYALVDKTGRIQEQDRCRPTSVKDTLKVYHCTEAIAAVILKPVIACLLKLFLSLFVVVISSSYPSSGTAGRTSCENSRKPEPGSGVLLFPECFTQLYPTNSIFLRYRGVSLDSVSPSVVPKHLSSFKGRKYSAVEAQNMARTRLAAPTQEGRTSPVSSHLKSGCDVYCL